MWVTATVEIQYQSTKENKETINTHEAVITISPSHIGQYEAADNTEIE